MNATTTNTEPRRHHSETNLLRELSRYGLPVLLVLVFVLFSALKPEYFFTWDNFKVTLDQQAPVMIGAVAAMFPLLTKQFDLSIAANISLANVILGVLTTNMGWPAWVAIVLAIVVSTIIGIVNGLIVEYWQVDSFVATLGMATLLAGFSYLITDSKDILSIPSEVTALARTDLGIFKLSVVWAAIVLVVVGFSLKFLPFGRKLAAVGFNRNAATLTGIPSARYLVGSFAAAGLLSGIAGVIITGQLGSATSSGIANSLLLPIFAAVFLGSTAFTPGRPNVAGIFIAALFLAFVSGGLVLIGAAKWQSPIINGTALIAAVAVSAWIMRVEAKRFKQQQLKALEESSNTGLAADS